MGKHNRRPTLLRVSAFCTRLLSVNPFDVDALRAGAVMPSVNSANDFGQQYWARLVTIEAETSRMPTFAALYLGLIASRTEAQWAGFVMEVNRVEEALPLVQAFAESKTPRIAGWGRRALRALRLLKHRTQSRNVSFASDLPNYNP